MKPETFNKLENLSNQIREKTIDIQQEIRKASSYVDPSYQRLLKEALAIRNEWKQMIITNFICAGFALVVGLCIVGLMGELGLFVAIPLLTPVTIYLLLDGLRLLLQGDPINEILDLRQKRRKK
jgi:hypothetical protein